MPNAIARPGSGAATIAAAIKRNRRREDEPKGRGRAGGIYALCPSLRRVINRGFLRR